MTRLTAKQLAKTGQLYLEEAILDVLWEAHHQKKCLGAAEISKQAGIFRRRGKQDALNDAIVTGMLIKLNEENKVRRCLQENTRGGWELTDQQLRIRPSDV